MKILPGVERRVERSHENSIIHAWYQVAVSPMKKATAIFLINAENIKVCDFGVHTRPFKA
ncbi:MULTISPECIES: hypothetical protein [unclassified Pantoea]|uniref:hypothetical protein n=1 Tax=unclassified Pantoea TaxID=2630326 RepID=UPI00301D47BE